MGETEETVGESRDLYLGIQWYPDRFAGMRRNIWISESSLSPMLWQEGVQISWRVSLKPLHPTSRLANGMSAASPILFAFHLSVPQSDKRVCSNNSGGNIE